MSGAIDSVIQDSTKNRSLENSLTEISKLIGNQNLKNLELLYLKYSFIPKPDFLRIIKNHPPKIELENTSSLDLSLKLSHEAILEISRVRYPTLP